MDAKANYESITMTLNEHMTSAMNAMRAMRGSYPINEVDVDEQIYVSLDEERHFERQEVTLAQHIAELREIAATAPKGVEVVIEFEQDYGYDDDRITVRKVGYWRDPTPEERAEREADNKEAREHNARLAEQKAIVDRAEFERLKAKFASDSDTRPKDGDGTEIAAPL